MIDAGRGSQTLSELVERHTRLVFSCRHDSKVVEVLDQFILFHRKNHECSFSGTISQELRMKLNGHNNLPEPVYLAFALSASVAVALVALVALSPRVPG